jgi:predicted alpha/beta superfamily hydrolase
VFARRLDAAPAIALAGAIAWTTAPGRAGGPPVTAVAGDLRIERFASAVFGNTRALRVLVPPGYDAPGNRDRRYPVLYLNDGQNLFDAATSTFNRLEWRVDETVRELADAGRIPELIVVGIDHAGRRGRFHEYFPYVDAFLDPPDPDPQGARYPAFLVDEVLPFVESRYRVAREAGGRGVGGSSAGGLAALYAVVKRPGAFGRLLVESPSIYVDDARILAEAAAVSSWPDRIVLGAGTGENVRGRCDPTSREEPEVVRDVRRLADLLRARGVAADRLRVEIVPCARHDEAAWARRLPGALAFLYAAAGTFPLPRR